MSKYYKSEEKYSTNKMKLIKRFSNFLSPKRTKPGMINILWMVLIGVIVMVALFKIAPILTQAGATAQADTNADDFLKFFYQIAPWLAIGFGILAIGFVIVKKGIGSKGG